MVPPEACTRRVTDLARFMSVLFARGTGVHGRVVAEQSLEEMWRPQFAASGARTGFGLGFDVASLDGQRVRRDTTARSTVSRPSSLHSPMTSSASRSPSPRTARTRSRLTLRRGAPADARDRRRCAAAGAAGHGSSIRWTWLVDWMAAMGKAIAGRRDGARLAGVPNAGDRNAPQPIARAGRRYARRRRRAVVRTARAPARAHLIVGNDTLTRRQPRRGRAQPPERWRGLIGEYGWDHNTLYILERDGRLHALIEWFFDYPLDRVEAATSSRSRRRACTTARHVSSSTGAPTARRPKSTVGGVRVPAAPARRRGRRDVPHHAGAAARRAARRGARRDAARGDGQLRHAGSRRAGDARPHASSSTSATRRRTTSSARRSTTQARAFMQRPAAEALVRAHQALRRHGLRPADPRCLPAVVRDARCSGTRRRDSSTGLRRRPGAGLAAQPRLRGRSHALRSRRPASRSRW